MGVKFFVVRKELDLNEQCDREEEKGCCFFSKKLQEFRRLGDKEFIVGLVV